MNVLLKPPASDPAKSRGENRILMEGIRWETYKALLEDLGERQLRLTYDEGLLEIMTLSSTHEMYKRLLGRLLETLTLVMRIPIRSIGSTTLKPELVKKGLEPDECYYVLNESQIRGKLEIDLDVDPPPDLAIEVDISRSTINRLNIYAALGVPEVWRFDGHTLHVYHLQAKRTYVEAEASLNVPAFPVREIVRFLQPSEQDETSLMWSFVDWVKQTAGIK